MHFDYSKLLGRIAEKMGTQAIFSKKMGLSERTISLKLNGRIAFRQDEMIKACEVLDIPKEEIGVYFFTPIVQRA